MANKSSVKRKSVDEVLCNEQQRHCAHSKQKATEKLYVTKGKKKLLSNVFALHKKNQATRSSMKLAPNGCTVSVLMYVNRLLQTIHSCAPSV